MQEASESQLSYLPAIAVFSSPLTSLSKIAGYFALLPRPVVPDLLLWVPDFTVAQPTATIKNISYRATH